MISVFILTVELQSSNNISEILSLPYPADTVTMEAATFHDYYWLDEYIEDNFTSDDSLVVYFDIDSIEALKEYCNISMKNDEIFEEEAIGVITFCDEMLAIRDRFDSEYSTPYSLKYITV